jgi:hypothetical protein
MLKQIRPIIGYEERYAVTEDGKVWSFINNKWLMPRKVGVKKKMYYSFVLYTDNKNYINKKAHTLVAEAFLKNPDNKPTVDHIDRNKLNNITSNLRWSTHKEQAANRSGKFCSIPVINKNTNKLYASIKEASNDNNISCYMISKDINNNCKTWYRHI